MNASPNIERMVLSMMEFYMNKIFGFGETVRVSFRCDEDITTIGNDARSIPSTSSDQLPILCVTRDIDIHLSFILKSVNHHWYWKVARLLYDWWKNVL